MDKFEKRDKELKEISRDLKKMLDDFDEDKLNSLSQEESEAFMVFELILDGDLEKLSSLPTSRMTSFVRALKNKDDSRHHHIDEDEIDEEKLLQALIIMCEETTSRANKSLDESHEKIKDALERINQSDKK
ncbi:hypothetical protein [Marinicella gelatinilytica]|uniref:hypothetical protein n=1 Tax=Marinicella gelatinilytica TaxID=2996017 RepID=UPI002260A056|nr:hypothetical protein [Marinicella gelatinilytica]MCX7546250.1 hypothetical protein [Marinicella gelatinilytica]